MNDVGNTVIYEDSFLMIIVNGITIDTSKLNWRDDVEGFGQLTLDEISGQIDTHGVVYVWTELGLNGNIYQHGNYSKVGWCEHGTTKGFA